MGMIADGAFCSGCHKPDIKAHAVSRQLICHLIQSRLIGDAALVSFNHFGFI
jgi:hypothetical protein